MQGCASIWGGRWAAVRDVQRDRWGGALDLTRHLLCQCRLRLPRGLRHFLYVVQYEYDGGAAGGNSNQTKVIRYLTDDVEAHARVTKFKYDWRDRQVFVIDAEEFSSKVTYSRVELDNLGRTIKSERYYDLDDDEHFPTDGTVDAGDRLLARTEQLYDKLGHVYRTKTYAVNPNDGTVGSALVSDTWRDAVGRTIKQQDASSRVFSKTAYDSGTAGTYAGFDRFGRVVDHLWYDYGASADRDRFTYGYDRASSRLYRENTVASGKDEFYSYDAVNRLVSFDRGDLNVGKTAISGTPVKEEDWGLDMTGNWTDFLQKTSGSTDLNQDRTHNPVNEITAITETVGTAWVDPVHDRAGNMTTVPKPSSLSTALTCTWDAWHRLVEVKQGAVVVGRYEYDGLGRRSKSHVDSQSPANPNGVDAYVHYFYNQGWQELESRRTTSENTGPESLQPQYQYVWSRRYIDAPVLRDKNTDVDGLCDDERIYYLGDANFNITTLISTAGDAVERYVYSPYGVLTIYDATWANVRSASSYANAYTYTGRQLDTETGLYYYRARVYSPQLGRFVSRDSLDQMVQTADIYQYVRSNPVHAVDPTGQIPIVCTCSRGHRSFEVETNCTGSGQACCEAACGVYSVIRWRIAGAWGAGLTLDIDALCAKIAESGNPRCKRCCSCKETFEALIQAAQTIHTTFPEKCQKWVWEFQKLPREVQNPENGCYKTGGVHWNKWWLFPDPFFPGHAAIKVEVCDGSILYLDSGFWGGCGNVFAPPEVGGDWGTIKWNPIPDVEENIIW